jgi:hypothetical protein
MIIANAGEKIGHELLSFLFHFVHKNLSTLDPASLAFGIAAAFDSSRKCRRALTSPAHYVSKEKAP